MGKYARTQGASIFFDQKNKKVFQNTGLRMKTTTIHSLVQWYEGFTKYKNIS